MIGLDRPADLGHVPARQVTVDPVHQGRVISHLGGHGTEQVADWSKETPETSSKQTTSYWQTRPLCPELMFTNIRATVALPPETRWA